MKLLPDASLLALQSDSASHLLSANASTLVQMPPRQFIYGLHARTDEAKSLYQGCDQSLASALRSEGRKFPHVIVVGVQKGGTNSLKSMLQTSMYNISCGPPDEVHFFDQYRWVNKTIDKAAALKYLQRWEGCPQEYHDRADTHIRFEKTPDYMTQLWTPMRSCQALGKSQKFILMLREPVARSYSSFYNGRRVFKEIPYNTSGFHLFSTIELRLVEECDPLPRGPLIGDDAMRAASFRQCCKRLTNEMGLENQHYPGCGCDDEAMAEGDSGFHCTLFGDKRASQVRNSVYAPYLRLWLRSHPTENLMIFRSEDFFAASRAVLREMASFARPELADVYHQTHILEQHHLGLVEHV